MKVERVMGEEVLVIPRDAMRALAEAAFTDINHLLRPAHLASLQARSSTIRRRRTTTSSSPTTSQERQYRRRRRAADVPGHRHRDHHGQEGPADLDRWRRRGGARRGRARCLSQAQSALFAARADFHVRGEEHALEHAGAGRDLRRGRRRTRRRLQVSVHRQGRRLGQQIVSVPGDALDPDARAPCWPSSRRRC